MNIQGQTIAGFELTQPLNAGRGDRHVFAARREAGREPCVVKIAPVSVGSPGPLAREFRILSQLSDCAVATALSYGVSLDHQVEYLALRAEGPSLTAILQSVPHCRLPPDVALRVVTNVAKALGTLHQRGWFHGDVKPGNLILPDADHAILTDLEFAGRVDGEWINPSEPFAGTPPFVAPEVWRQGRSALGPTADIWALGVVLYIALTGAYPFGDSPVARVRRSILAGQPRALPDYVTPALGAVVMKLLTPDPDKRPRDGLEVVHVLRSAEREVRADDAGPRLLELIRQTPQFIALFGPETITGLEPLPSSEPGTDASLAAEEEFEDDEFDEMVESDQIPEEPRPPRAEPSPPPKRQRWRRSGRGMGKTFVEFKKGVRGLDEESLATNAAPAAGAAEALRPVPLPDVDHTVGAEEIRRQTATRWYKRMNPGHNFTLKVLFSGKKIKLVSTRQLGVTVGKKDIVVDKKNPYVVVEPVFPGCLVSPPRMTVDLTPETTIAKFWITPLVEAEMPEACVRVYQRDELLESLPTPTKSVKRTWAYLCLAAGVFWPLLQFIFARLGLSFEEQFDNGMPLLADLFGFLGNTTGTALLVAVFLGLAAFFYHITRPVQTTQEEVPLFEESG